MASTKKSRRPARGANVLSLDKVVELGGTKEDLKLLEGVDNADESEEEAFSKPEDQLDADPINREEVRELIRQLGIKQHRPSVPDPEPEKKDKKSKKSKESSAAEDREEDDQVSTQPAEPADGEKKKKKKKKNKFQVQDAEVSSTTRNLVEHIESYQPRKYLLVKAGESVLEAQVEKEMDTQVDSGVIQQLETLAAKLLDHEVSLYNQQREKGRRGEMQFQRDMLGGKGTVENRISMLTLSVLHSPFHTLPLLESLVAMARKKNTRESMSAADKLGELFEGHILPSDRKLKAFNQHAFGQLMSTDLSRDVVDKRLVVWYFESELKKKYATFLSAVEELSRNTVPAPRQKAISIMQKLLLEKPEGENTLLPMLVNKLGDPHGATAAKASHALSCLVRKHPQMKMIVLKEIEQFLFRKNTDKAKYNGVCFLNQLILTPKEKDVAVFLLKTYFAFFKACVKKGEMDSRFMGALLSGVNRAYPFAKLELSLLDEQVNTLFKIVHVVNFSISLQALLLLEKITESTCDRYYTTLYGKLLDPALKSSSKQALFLHLVFRSMKKDTSDRRVQAFMKRLLQLCQYMPNPFVCGALIMLSEILKEKPHLLVTEHAVQKFESDDDDEHYSDAPDSSDEEREEKTEDVSPGTLNGRPHQSSWVHRGNTGYKSESRDYDMYHRNPQYSRAEQEVLWELQSLVHHHHPSVAIFASNILQGKPIDYSGDPLQDFSLIRFMERFAYKNPKKVDEKKPVNKLARGKSAVAQGIRAIPVNSKEYLQQGEENIPADEMFYYKYLTLKKAREVDESDLDSEVSDSEFDDFLDAQEKTLDGRDAHLNLDKDFFSGVDGSLKSKKKRRRADSDSEEDEDDDDLPSDLSGEDLSFDEDDDLAAEFRREMAEAGEDGSEEDDEEDDLVMDEDEDEELPTGKKRKTPSFLEGPSRKKKKTKLGGADMFAAAEEFADMLEDPGEASLGSLTAVVNKDSSSMKQLKWESDRHQKGEWKHKKKNRMFKRKLPKGGKKR